jgi:hypothetical protein
MRSKYHDQYQREDTEVVFHDFEDKQRRDLDVIPIELPNLEQWYSEQLKREVTRDEALTFVDGYGLAPEDQVFTKQKMPDRLKKITDFIFKNYEKARKYKEIKDVKLEHIYDELEMNPENYADEIYWIKLQIKRRYVGYWFFNNGKPTYLNGANYFFLNFWKIKNFGKNDDLPDYRDYQRQMFHMLMYAYTTTDAFFKHKILYRENGITKTKYTNANISDALESIKEKGADYILERDFNSIVRMPKRTVHGINFVSSRRVAKTAISCCFCTWGTLNMPDQTFIIQAMNEDQAVNKIFIKQIQTPISKLPFFFRPHYRGRLEAEKGLRFQYDGDMATASRAGIVPDQMECFITPGASTEKAFDGEAEIAFVYRDEPAKKTDEKAADQNIPKWWNNTMKPAIERGDNIRGFCIMPSTVGDMDTGGGSQFLEVVNGSHFTNRNDNGRTDTGLLNFFMPGWYAAEGYIDKYGYSIVEDPEEPVLTNEGIYVEIGAKTWVKNTADNLERKGNWEDLIKHQQNFPGSWRDAFAIIPKSMGLPITEMREALKDLKFKRAPTTLKGNFKWIGNELGGDVYWENDSNGKWVMAYLPPVQFRNKKTVVTPDEGYIPPAGNGTIYAPEATVANKFFFCGDPVKFNKRNTSGGKKSAAAGAMFYKQDSSVDMIDGKWKPREQWVSNDWTMFYKEKTENKDEYHEEWLKACIFHGAYMYPEFPDGEDITEYFRKHGFDGYLLKDMGTDGKVESRPGVWATPATINEMVGDVMTYFKNNVKYCKIWEIIEEWTQMRGVDDLTNHDLCAASGWCMRAIKSRLPEIYKEFRETIEVKGTFEMFVVD